MSVRPESATGHSVHQSYDCTIVYLQSCATGILTGNWRLLRIADARKTALVRTTPYSHAHVCFENVTVCVFVCGSLKVGRTSSMGCKYARCVMITARRWRTIPFKSNIIWQLNKPERRWFIKTVIFQN